MARIALKLLPWLIIAVLAAALYYQQLKTNQPSQELVVNTLLTEIEALGKLELVQYNFQEITEIKQISEKYLKLFSLDRDSKIVLISHGNAIACIDLTKIAENDVVIKENLITLVLPSPEICNYKLDLQNSRIYALETGYFLDEEEFIAEAYRTAEAQVKEAALASGILDQAEVMGQSLLVPMLKKLTGKNVVVQFGKSQSIRLD